MKNRIIQFEEKFLEELCRKCVEECGRSLTSIERAVMRRFLEARVRRERELNRECIEVSEMLKEIGCAVAEQDLEELIEKSMILDKKLLRDIRFLPIEVSFDYERIIPYRRERLKKQTGFFLKMLSSGTSRDYGEMARKAYSRDEYLEINDELIELYAEEAYLINSSLKTPFSIGRKDLAERMYCSMIDLGRRLIRERASIIFG